MGGHDRDTTRLLQGLVAQDALRQQGTGRWARYRLPVACDPLQTGPGSEHKGDDSVHKAVGSEHKDDDSVQSGQISEADFQALCALAAPARQQQRLTPKEMERIILRLCRGHWLSRRQLGELLHRNADSIRQRFLTPMVEHGYLRLRYPDTPNRADQAYSAATTHD